MVKPTNSGLKPRRPRSNRAAVVVLDVLSDFRFADGPAVRRALIARCRSLVRLLYYARQKRVPVVYVNDNAGLWRSDAPALLRRFISNLPPTGQSLVELAPGRRDLVILKPRHSAFFATPLEIVLQQLAISHLVLAGVSTESCVWMTACDAHIRGFRLIVPQDVVAGASRPAVTATFTGLRTVLGVRTPARASRLRFSNGRIL